MTSTSGTPRSRANCSVIFRGFCATAARMRSDFSSSAYPVGLPSSLFLRITSTPFDVTEIDTTDGEIGLPIGCKCSTPFGITEFGTPRLRGDGGHVRAQRLSASLNSALSSRCIRSTVQRAQRLSASLNSAPCWELVSCGVDVLNAFRHH